MQLRLFPALALAAAIVLPGAALASSHSEAPGTSKDRLADDTDLYAWVAGDAPDAVTFVGNWVPLIEPNSGPNFASFDDQAEYYINIDNVGDCHAHIRYQFKFHTVRSHPNTFLYNTGVVTSFDDPDLNVRQYATVTRFDIGRTARRADGGEGDEDDNDDEGGVGGARGTVIADNVPVAPYFVGPHSMPDYNALAQSVVQTLPDGTRLFIGPRDDPFFVDLAAIFDLLTIRRLPGNTGGGIDGLGGFNVMSIVLQVPKKNLTWDHQAPNAGNAVIGIYDSAERARYRILNADGTVSTSGPDMQVSRLGNPLVNEVVIPLKSKDLFNASKPAQDAQFLNDVLYPELPGLIHALYGVAVPDTPRTDLATVFLTGIPGVNKPANPRAAACEMLRLNMMIPPASNPNPIGVIAGDAAGFPNGRRLIDDVVDIEERAVAGGYVLTPTFNVSPNNALGDGVDANDLPLLPAFPYVAPPHDPFAPHHSPAGTAPAGLQPVGTGAAASIRTGDADGLRFAGPHPGRVAVLQYTLQNKGYVTLKVYDVQGRAVRTLVDQPAAAGSFRATWDGRSDDGGPAGKGVFFARLTHDGRVVDSRKLVLE
jgi:uncharacterized protein DUF4331/flagellar hook capping protein FlgD